MLMTGLCVSLNQGLCLYAHDSFQNVTHCEKFMYQLRKTDNERYRSLQKSKIEH